MPVCTALTMSARIGERKTSGNAHEAPLPFCTVTVGNAAGMVRREEAAVVAIALEGWRVGGFL